MSKIKDIIEKILNAIGNNSFVKSVMTLSSGAVVSQIVSMITTPIISRIYNPEILGDFSLIISNASIIGIIVCLGLMTAIMIPKKDEEAKGLCRLITFSIVCLTSLFIAFAILISPYWKIFEVSIDYTTAYIVLWLYVILSNTSSVCYAYVNRRKMYKILFWNPIIGIVTNSTISIVLGVLGCGLFGYILGNIGAMFASITHMLIHANPFFGKVKYKKNTLLKKYKRFLLYQLPSNIIDIFSQQLPVQLIGRFFGSIVLGSYTMCLTILGMPSKLLAAPIGRVYFQEASNRYNEGKDIGEFSYKILKTNIKIAVIPIFLLMVFGKPVFTFVLGDKWANAGSFSSILGMYQLVLFCCSCLSGSYVIIKKQNFNLFFSLSNIIIGLLSFYLSYFIFHDVYSVLIIYSIFGTICKLASVCIFLYCTGVKINKFVLFTIQYIFLPTILAVIVKKISGI